MVWGSGAFINPHIHQRFNLSNVDIPFHLWTHHLIIPRVPFHPIHLQQSQRLAATLEAEQRPFT